MKIYPHILIKEGDRIILPGAQKSETVIAVGLINGQLLVQQRTNRFVLPYGFYLKKIAPVGLVYFEPILD